ncbi:MAG: DUF2839 domain-containing protein [Thermosynechococcaceae cyanobacterium MS004]|jgi:hypothetical protein|nr:DUF2839 domain-containing protein [Thermosynechococcaceae cyanobacterium MS004]
MGEAKRRKEQLGEKYGQPETSFLSGLSVGKFKPEQFVKWSTRGAWIGIGAVVVVWVVIRFIGPGFGWWEVQ